MKRVRKTSINTVNNPSLQWAANSNPEALTIQHKDTGNRASEGKDCYLPPAKSAIY